MSLLNMLFKKNKNKMDKKDENLDEELIQQLLHEEDGSKLISVDINENIRYIKSSFNNSSDILYRSFSLGDKQAAIVYVSGLANEDRIYENVLNPLMKETNETISVKQLIENKITVSEIKQLNTLNGLINDLAIGYQILLIDQSKEAIALGLPKWEKRSIEEPTAEQVVRGPREGFTETIDDNISLLRRRIRSPKLTFQSKKFGEVTQTEVAVAYINGIVDKTLLEEVNNRLNRIKIDGILDSSYIEELIEDNPYSPFPQILNTERPDVVTSYLLEGHVAIIVDGSPFVMIAPTTMYALLQAAEDYYERYIIGTALRWLRYLFVVMALLFPSMYVAILTYHQEMLPTTLIISIAESRERVPFPALIEALLMEIMFEILREAGIRLPKQVGPAVGIVGALVIGEAAVQAGIVSAPMVIVVAVTGIASFAIPRYNAGISIRMLRFPIIILAGSIGLLGIMLGVIAIVIHLCSLRSFGMPYLGPLAPMQFKDIKDVLIRPPRWKMDTRPNLSGNTNEERQLNNQKPSPSQGGS
ncbi:spore germination protein [Evansella sp. AB-P1]|uniref:spore germination protein n=1 Tax=Evansella sp. AB-P1 TaxID=3037653 RepID=UPI00241CA012|nr:spore germination protein [Evansella sp. AB-P1]MDG5786805.1 spore germination protein [Evansella sp. AB-P1]